MSAVIDMSCNILDDEDLEKVASSKPSRMELRQWIPDVAPKENPFEKGFIKPSYSFPRAFQNKTQTEEFPPLLYRGVPLPPPRATANLSTTTNLLMRVKERLEKEQAPPPAAAVSSSTVVVGPPKVERVESPPLYAVCTPDRESHTPPYAPE